MINITKNVLIKPQWAIILHCLFPCGAPLGVNMWPPELLCALFMHYSVSTPSVLLSRVLPMHAMKQLSNLVKKIELVHPWTKSNKLHAPSKCEATLMGPFACPWALLCMPHPMGPSVVAHVSPGPYPCAPGGLLWDLLSFLVFRTWLRLGFRLLLIPTPLGPTIRISEYIYIYIYIYI